MAGRLPDRVLLVQFNHIIAKFRKLKPTYQVIIKDITKEWGIYVAGIVGEGLTYLFVEAEIGKNTLINYLLYRSIGLLLQKNNIIRNIRKDFDNGRRFGYARVMFSQSGDF
ncbi:hypothetical protein N7509_004384 [Penicillium cosmopolitanum]|uniref:Uncharacterized protein n=1 Tax=Penicillium cosmopolitanum TaxID=1131564 RepID=A0A9W9W793_9EURO|nr:uncharacterized protein N7509_004384 [Penicillium cosmopolitanum]KAJ5404513.1 hypothetical protein N7509_004384 [Penicillium cosmopolitanum]